MDEPHRRHDWKPATSRPGEMYIVEERIASAGSIARGRRAKAYRRSALRFAAGWVVAGGIIAFVAAMLLKLL